MSAKTDRQRLLDKIDALSGEVDRLIERANEFSATAERLELQAEHNRDKYNEMFAMVRKRNGEIDNLIAELRGKGKP